MYQRNSELLIHSRLCYAEYLSPNVYTLETGRMMKLLSSYPQGLTKEEILSLFYCSYKESTALRQDCLKKSFEKVVQRARIRYSKYKLTIQFHRGTKRYQLTSTDELNFCFDRKNHKKHANLH